MSADYNRTDKSKCSGRRRASWSNFVKGRWPGWAVPTAPRSPQESPRSRPLPGAALRRAPATPGAGFCVYFLLNDWSSCCSIPREMLNIPAWNIWKSSVGALFRSLKTGRNGSLFFPQMVCFPFQKLFPSYGGTPEKTLWSWEVFFLSSL